MLLGCKRAPTCGKSYDYSNTSKWRCSKNKSNATLTKHSEAVSVLYRSLSTPQLRKACVPGNISIKLLHCTTMARLYHNCTTLLYQSTVPSLMSTRAIRCRGNGLGRRPPYFGRDCLSSTLFWSHSSLLSVIRSVLVAKQFADAHPTFGRIHGNCQSMQ